MRKRHGHRLFRTSFVAAAGAAAMYFADPEQGAVRRALLRQRTRLWARRTEDLVINEPLATSAAMVDLREVEADLTDAKVADGGVTLVEVITVDGPTADLPQRAPISDETMTVDEAVFHAARTGS